MVAALNPFIGTIFNLFLISAVLITMYTLNFYYLSFLSSRRTQCQDVVPFNAHPVTVQLPIYNEKYVATRLIDAVCKMDYPKDQMRIMVLDDSDDDTVELVAKLVKKYQNMGFNIEHIRRPTRSGYKAGALKYAMKTTKTDFVAIFDADFMPKPWFLKRVLPYFAKSSIGFVQCRWGHVNENYSIITQVQAMSLDFHFLIEQKAKSHSHLFMNFNGTAGVWRRICIEDAGGWHSATLVEDLDLSYRAQMRGWDCIFLPDIVVDAELPVQMNAVKRQQFRWAKGSIQCAVKQIADIAVKRKIKVDTKIQAFFQLTRHIVFPLILLQFLTLPVLLASEVNLYIISYLPVITLATYMVMGPFAYALIIQKMYGKSWTMKIKMLPYLLMYSAGLSVNNTVAVFDAIFGKKNEFLRTPKYGILRKSDSWEEKAYNLPFTKTTLLEIFFGIYGIFGIMIAIYSNNPTFVPVILIPTLGFLYIAYMSLSHSRFKTNKSKSKIPITREQKMANITYKLALMGILALVVIGSVTAYLGYVSQVYPLDLSRGLLDAISTNSDPNDIAVYILAIKEHLPSEGNPVWIFPTETTNYSRMQRDLDVMLASAQLLATTPMDSSAFNTGMLDIKARSIELSDHILDAIPYEYASILNIILLMLWVSIIIAIFAVLKRKKNVLTDSEEPSQIGI
ncbi:MAG: glycosyl transferase [Cenarchaeum symbiont of Oopsacas minuta]|nr:glycosyl transferase [Cenarchaeum symbiont of Oopsacas minuta]